MSWVGALLIVLAVGGGILVAVGNLLRRVYRIFVPDPELVPTFLKYDKNFLNLAPIQRYKIFYKPGIAQINEGYSPVWRSNFGVSDSRDHEASSRIDIADLEFFRANPANLRSAALQRLANIEELSNYPGRPPTIETAPTPPRKPKFIDIDEVFALEATKQFTVKQRDLVKSHIIDLNAVLQDEYDVSLEQYLSAVSDADAKLKSLRATWERNQTAWIKERSAEVAQIQALIKKLDSLDIEKIASEVIKHLSLPFWVPNNFELKFDVSNRILILEHEYPNIEALEWVKSAQLKRSVSTRSVNKSEAKQAASILYPALTLTLAVALATQIPVAKVDAVVVNGWANHRSKATGELQRAYCAALVANIDRLKAIDLRFVDPVTAFAALKGKASRSLDLTPVAPTLRMDVSDRRFVDPQAVLSNLTDGENLASMDWGDFEHLCRELFERVFASAGATVSVTQASRDQGVDAIIHDPDPIRGGKMVIQAKRYVNTVDVSAVRDLWGTVSHEGAMKGLLVTTSQFGPDAYAFAQDKPITLINGSELLYLLEQNGYSFRIDLEEARKLQRETGAPSFQRRGRSEMG